MQKLILFLILSSLIFNTTIFSKPRPDTLITLTADFGCESGSVEVPYSVLKNSKLISSMLQSCDSTDNNIEPIPLEGIFQSVFKNLQALGVEFLFSPQYWLNEIADILQRIQHRKKLHWNFSMEHILGLIFIGDILDIKKLVRRASSALAKNIANVSLEVLLGLMKHKRYHFEDILGRKIVQHNHNLFFPIYLEPDAAHTNCESRSISVARFSKNYRTMAAISKKNKIEVFNLDDTNSWLNDLSKTWKHTQTIWEHVETKQLKTIDLSQDGKYIISTYYDDYPHVWKKNNARFEIDPMLLLPIYHENIIQASFSPDGTNIVTALDNQKLKIFQKIDERWSEVATLEGHTDDITYVCFSPDGKSVVSTSSDKTAKIWEPIDDDIWTNVVTLSGHTHEVNYAEFSRDNKNVVTASFDSTARIWTKDNHGNWDCVAILKEVSNANFFLARFSPDGKKLATLSTYGTKIWKKYSDGSWKGVTKLLILKGDNFGNTLFLEFSQFGNYLAVAYSKKTVKIWDLSFVDNTLSLRQALLCILAKYHKYYFEHLKKCEKIFIQKILGALPSELRWHLDEKYNILDYIIDIDNDTDNRSGCRCMIL